MITVIPTITRKYAYPEHPWTKPLLCVAGKEVDIPNNMMDLFNRLDPKADIMKETEDEPTSGTVLNDPSQFVEVLGKEEKGLDANKEEKGTISNKEDKGKKETKGKKPKLLKEN